MDKTALDTAIKWKLKILADDRARRREYIAKYKNDEQNGATKADRDAAKGLKETNEAEVKTIDKEDKVLRDPKASDARKLLIVKINLKKHIQTAESWLRTLADKSDTPARDDVRLVYEREIAEWKKMDEALTVD